MEMLTPHQSAALNYERSISLTANAGSGKTFVLAKRYIEIALNKNINLNKIAAITFTDKAAGELYKKIAIEIDRLSEKSFDEVLKSKFISIRRELVSAKISTIHSFCLDILREYPVEASLDANFLPIDEIISNELIELSTEAVIDESLLNISGSETVKSLIRLLGSKKKLADELKKLISGRKNVLSIARKIYDKSVEDIGKFFHNSFSFLAGEVISIGKMDFIECLQKVNNLVLQNEADNEIALKTSELSGYLKKEVDIQKNLVLIVSLKNLLCTDSGTIKSLGYLSTKLRAKLSIDVITNLENFLHDIGSISLNGRDNTEYELAEYGKLIIEIFRKVLARYDVMKREHGYLDFEDILLKTKNILNNNNVKNRLSEKYKYLLVDEFQDTNELQYQIFLPIVDNLKSGNLFVVGDEKQSIYKFRDAELEVFNQTKKIILDAENEDSILSLPDSFRMFPAICLFTNVVFKKLFDNPSGLYNEVEYSEIVCANQNNIKGKIEFLLADSDEEIAEAELVAKRIQQLINEKKEQGFKWNDIAVLVRKRTSFSKLEKTFTHFGIPYTIIGGKGFFQRQIIYDVHNYFSFLLNEDNDAALVGILRSPFFNVSDAKIFELSRQTENSLFKKLLIAGNSNQYWRKIADKLNENLSFSKRMNFPVILRKIINDSAIHSVTASKQDGKQDLANIEKLIKMTIDFSDEGFKSLYDYVDYLGQAIQKFEDVSQAAIGKENEGVNILTIHQAKGLEYEAVFLFNCNDSSQRNLIKAKEIFVNKKYGILTRVPEKQNYFTDYKAAPIVNICSLIEDKKDLAEIKRLLYVAITRARSGLFISSVEPAKNFRDRSFMSLLGSGLGCDFSQNEIQLNGNLTYLKLNEDKFVNFQESLDITIPIVRKIELTGEVVAQKFEISRSVKFNFHNIDGSQSGEMISASKFSAYSQCPVKYKLAYKLGLQGISLGFSDHDIRTDKIINEYSNTGKSNELQTESLNQKDLPSIVKGRIIHSVLEQNPEHSLIHEVIQNENKRLNKIDPDSEKIREEITAELFSFYKSDEYRYLNSFIASKNEFEIYIKENNYFLHGIIDKLIFNDSKLIVVDYKTDELRESEFEEKSAIYKNQILFYLYIVSIKFNRFSEFEGRLVFTKLPDSPVVFKFTPEIKIDVKKRIHKFISDIRKNNFIPNHDHCHKCKFSEDRKNCILEKQVQLN